MGVKEYVQSEFDNVEAEIISANKDIFSGTITFDDFLWAFGILRSRVFSGLRGDKLALIPFADLVGSLNTNHVDMIKLLIQKGCKPTSIVAMGILAILVIMLSCQAFKYFSLECFSVLFHSVHHTYTWKIGNTLCYNHFGALPNQINHDADITSKESCWDIKGKGLFDRDVVFSLRTPVDVKSGEQIYIQYDLDKSNAELALDYGFTESNSSRDAYTLTMEIPESDPFYGDKLDIAELNGLGETAYFDVVLGEPLPPQMLPYLRLLCLGGTDAFLLEALFRNTVWDHLELPVSPDNEESICQVIRNACKSALAAYRTTVEEDEEVLKREDLQPRHQVAIGVRVGEKKVLQQIDDIFKQREQELDGLEYYQERRLKDLGFVGDNGEIIFWES